MAVYGNFILGRATGSSALARYSGTSCLSYHELLSQRGISGRQIEHIYTTTQGEHPAVGLLTASNRDTWSKVRSGIVLMSYVYVVTEYRTTTRSLPMQRTLLFFVTSIPLRLFCALTPNQHQILLRTAGFYGTALYRIYHRPRPLPRLN